MTTVLPSVRRGLLRHAWLVPAVVGSLQGLAHAQTVDVSSRCNIYGAGHAAAVGSCSTSIGPGILPVLVAVPPGATYAEFHNATGAVQYCPTCTPTNGPDGVPGLAAANPALNGVSGLTVPQARSFEGVFLANAEPANPPPPTLVINDIAFSQLSPQNAQHFFIGDGLTGTGTGSVQRFFIPAGATRLFLGFSDGFTGCVGAFDDNTGSVNVTVVFDAPSCDPDVNQDGNADQDDVAYLINVIGGGPNPTGIDPDFNHDGNADQDDISALITVVAGGACP